MPLPESGSGSRSVRYEVRQAKKKGEDAFATLDEYIGDELVHLVLVCDGHGGSVAAHECASHLLGDIVQEARDCSEAEMVRAMRASFLAIHERIKQTTDSGCACTAIAVVASSGALYCANVGDVVRSRRPPHTRRARAVAQRAQLPSLRASLTPACSPPAARLWLHTSAQLADALDHVPPTRGARAAHGRVPSRHGGRGQGGARNEPQYGRGRRAAARVAGGARNGTGARFSPRLALPRL